jgi:signal transduction histidine kinase
VHGDVGRLEQVVVNLLSNAVKFSPQGGRIDLALSQSGVDGVIVVRDGGVGIATDRLPHVFDPFSRQANDRSSRHAGLGLGLARARQIVTLHHGDVTASSEGVGCGSKFSVHLPFWNAPLATA